MPPQGRIVQLRRRRRAGTGTLLLGLATLGLLSLAGTGLAAHLGDGQTASCWTTVCASARPTEGPAPLTVGLTLERGRNELGSGYSIETWGTWWVAWGDGSPTEYEAPSPKLTATHTYPNPGAYRPTYGARVVLDTGSETAIGASGDWIVVGPNEGPPGGPPASGGGPRIGFAEDATKYADDGGAALFDAMAKLGASTNRVVVPWDANAPTTIQDEAFLDRMIPVAAGRGIQVVVAVYPATPAQAPTTPAAVDQFCDYTVQVMRRYPSVRKVIVGNEPNQPRFWQPIWNANGSPASPRAMEAVLASCYDKLKAYDRSIDVIGLGLSPRGNDAPTATSNASLSPMRFLAALGKAYRASGRTAPLFDELSWHCYPNVNTNAVEQGYSWPNAGCVDAARIKLALWDAFHGTGQPVTAGYAQAGAPTLGTFVDETGWQVDTSSLDGYTGPENVPTVDEATQAQAYEKLVRLADCEPTLTDFHLFHVIDEADRTGFQSGVLRLDASERPSATDPSASVRHAIAADRGSCSGGTWQTLGSFLHPTNALVPVYKTFPYQGRQPFAAKTISGGSTYVSLRAGEGFRYALTFRSGSWSARATGAAPRATAAVKVPTGFGRGTVTAVLTAETNPARTTAVTLDLGGRAGSAPTTGSVLRTLTMPYTSGRALAFDGKHLLAGDTQSLWEFDARTGKSLGEVELGWSIQFYGDGAGSGGRHYCCVQPTAADFAGSALYLLSADVFAASAPHTGDETPGRILWHPPDTRCAGGRSGAGTGGLAQLGAGTYALSGQNGTCVALSWTRTAAQIPVGDVPSLSWLVDTAHHDSDFAVAAPSGYSITGIDGDEGKGSGLWIALSNGRDSTIVHATRNGVLGTSFAIRGSRVQDVALDRKSFEGRCALWTNEARANGKANLRAYLVPCS